ncbi:MAG TPA: adenylate/guanylate cyclase domain-containing protein [Nocardioides sp.]|nr:adenylate/guanylate cyclase domain-containing protein [Nocardioides sp.]
MAEIWLVVGEGVAHEQEMRVTSRFHIGRECVGIADDHRLVLDDPAVSRDHCEIRLEHGLPVLLDLSTNGTRVNGRRVERGERSPLADGDELRVGDTTVRVRVLGERPPELAGASRDLRRTRAATDAVPTTVLVGDIIGYTAITEMNDGGVVARATDRLFGTLRSVVIEHGGLVSNYVGDAILATWEQATADGSPDQAAVRCAVACHRAAIEVAPILPLRDLAGRPLAMGWAVTTGPVAASRPSGGREALLGDAVVLAFRLAGAAGREGRPPVLAVEELAAPAADVAYGDPVELRVKGRAAAARVVPVTAAASGTEVR